MRTGGQRPVRRSSGTTGSTPAEVTAEVQGTRGGSCGRSKLGAVVAALAIGGLVTVAAVRPLAAQVSSSASSRTCEAGGEPRVGLGVGTYHCQGGSCLVDGIYATRMGLPAVAGALVEEHPGAWDFSVEPSLWEIRPDGPAAGRVREGDILVAVGGVPVTTRRGGFRLMEMTPNTPVELTVRRAGGGGTDGEVGPGGLVRVEVAPEESCASFTVSSGAGEVPGFLQRDGRGHVVRRDRVDGSLAPVPLGGGRVRFEGAGMVLAGATEVRVGADGRPSLHFTGDAMVAEVVEGGAADRAGLVVGEVVVSADDEPLESAEGVEALGRAAPGRPVLLFVGRGRSFRQVMIHER